jgi:hypothetical protein
VRNITLRGPARELDHGFVQGHVAVERRGATDDAIPADHGGLDHVARGQIHHQGDDSGMGEIDRLDRIAGVKKHQFLGQLDHLEVRQKRVPVGLRQGGEHLIGQMKGLRHRDLLP